MAFLRKANKKNFTVIDSDIIRDENLSLKDLGLLVRLLSLPDNWEFSENGLMTIFKKDKQGSIRTGLKNLENLGYLKRTKVRDNNGKFIGCDWIINEQPYLKNSSMDITPCFENPSMEFPSAENPNSDKPKMENPRLENQPQYNINQPNINESNINQHNINQSINHEQIKQSINYDVLTYEHCLDVDVIDEMIEIIYEILNSSKETIRVNGEEKLAEIVKSRFRKIKQDHIEYAILCFEKTTSDIRNIRNYLITTLYNSTFTIDNYYKQMVNHDLNQ